MNADAYSTLKLALLLLAIRRLLAALRHAWMYRATGLQGLYEWIVATVAPYLKHVPYVQRQLATEMSSLRESLKKDVTKGLTAPRALLPAKGQSQEELLHLLAERHEIDSAGWRDGRITGAIYHHSPDYMDFVGRVSGMFAFCNPLHMKLHPSTRQMESEVISMVINLYRGTSGCCGAFTTGGTESILMAIKSYRDHARTTRGVTRPNFVACATAHAAFDKAAAYFGVELRQAAAVDATMEVDLAQVRRMIDSNTIALVGSAPQYAHGTVDDIPALAELAVAHGIGLHVDCCLGGFLVPFMERAGYHTSHAFDFRVDGVTSISCDPHKYGFAPKGASILMFRTPELRHAMYTYCTEWTGGIYATPTILGSRPGGVIAATWAAMMCHGEEGYIETTRQIVSATRQIGAAIEAMPGVQLVGRPEVCVVAFTGADGLNCYSLCDAMKQVGGWELATLQRPSSVHFALTLGSSRHADAFLADLRTAVGLLRDDPETWAGGTAGLYGTLTKLPAAFIEESAKVFLDTLTHCAEEAPAAEEEPAPKENGH